MNPASFNPLRRLAVAASAATLVVTLAGCSTLTSALSSVIAPEPAPASDTPKKTSSSGSGRTAAYQYEFGTFYGSMWNVGWLGYKDSTYKTGQGTIWKFTSKGSGSADPVTFERALLKVNPDTSQWWRFRLDTGNEAILYEFLVGADTKVVKVRYKDPDSGAIEEFVPGASTGPSAGPSATPKSQAEMAKYKVDRQTVKVEAGSFPSDHYVYPDEQGQGTSETWTSQTVPGSIVKSLFTRTKDKSTSTMELIKIETGVTTVLGSF